MTKICNFQIEIQVSSLDQDPCVDLRSNHQTNCAYEGKELIKLGRDTGTSATKRSEARASRTKKKRTPESWGGQLIIKMATEEVRDKGSLTTLTPLS